jgi:replicative DNA helicase Mcm
MKYFDPETEVLTKTSWKQISLLSTEDYLATLHNDIIEYQRPTSVTKEKYTGKMYRLKTRGVDLFIGPNTPLYVAKGDYYNGKFDPPKKVQYPFELISPDKYIGKNKRFQKSGRWVGNEAEDFILPSYSYTNYTKITGPRTYVKNERIFKMNEWLKFLGWYVAEGWSHLTKGEIAISCNNTDGGKEKEIISEVLNSCGIDYSLAISKNNDSGLLFKVYSRQLAIWLNSECGHLAPNKKVPNFVKELTPNKIQLFLEALYQGDGYKAPTANTLTTTSKILADDVLELLLKIGVAGRLRHRLKKEPSTIQRKDGSTRPLIAKHDYYEINWLSKSFFHNTSNKGLAKNSFEGWLDYDGIVYSINIPTKLIYIRRNGIPVWCGT